MTLGEKIKQLMEENDITVSKLSELTGISIASISRTISNERKPKEEALIKIAKYLNVDPIILFELKENDKIKAKPKKVSIDKLIEVIKKLKEREQDKIFKEVFEDKIKELQKENEKLKRDSNTFKLMYKGASDRLAILEREIKNEKEEETN